MQEFPTISSAWTFSAALDEAAYRGDRDAKTDSLGAMSTPPFTLLRTKSRRGKAWKQFPDTRSSRRNGTTGLATLRAASECFDSAAEHSFYRPVSVRALEHAGLLGFSPRLSRSRLQRKVRFEMCCILRLESRRSTVACKPVIGAGERRRPRARRVTDRTSASHRQVDEMSDWSGPLFPGSER